MEEGSFDLWDLLRQQRSEPASPEPAGSPALPATTPTPSEREASHGVHSINVAVCGPLGSGRKYLVLALQRLVEKELKAKTSRLSSSERSRSPTVDSITVDAHTQLNLWNARSPSQLTIFRDIFEYSALHHIWFLVDLSKPKHIGKHLQEWREALRQFRESAREGSSAGQQAVRLTVVATKADTVQGVGSGGVVSQTQLRESQLNFMQAYLRRWCLENDASLVYISATTALNLHALVTLTVEPDPLQAIEPRYRDLQDVVIPRGWDDIERIKDLLQPKAEERLKQPYEAVLGSPEGPSTLTTESKGAEIPTHQEFLLELEAQQESAPQPSRPTPTRTKKGGEPSKQEIGKFFSKLLERKEGGK